MDGRSLYTNNIIMSTRCSSYFDSIIAFWFIDFRFDVLYAMLRIGEGGVNLMGWF